MSRKNGCPFSIRDWQVDVKSRASTSDKEVWLRVKGLTSMDYSLEGDTEDGSTAESLFSEPYVSKRSGSISLEGKPASDAVTGAQDPGQAELDYYSMQGGCDGDATIRITDAYGHSTKLDVVVTSRGRNADDTSETVSWDMEVVGEPEEIPYVQVSSISTSPASTTTVEPGNTQSVTVTFTPENASNQKYSVASSDTSKVKVQNIDGLSFDIVGIAEGSAGVVVRSMNNSKEAKITVTVQTAPVI